MVTEYIGNTSSMEAQAMYTLGMTLFVRQRLSLDQRSLLVDGLKQIDGIQLARFFSNRQDLLTVEYDPSRVKSGEVINYMEGKGIMTQQFLH